MEAEEKLEFPIQGAESKSVSASLEKKRAQLDRLQQQLDKNTKLIRLYEENYSYLYDLYWNQGVSLSRIGEQYGVDKTTVKTRLIELSIPIRTRDEAHKLTGLGQRGANSRLWKGGHKQHSEGYVLLYNPEHPRAQQRGMGKKCYVPEHIVIWEQYHGKPVPEGWVIHHLNGIKDDNRPSNLMALPDRAHKRVLAAKAQRIRELELELDLVKRKLLEFEAVKEARVK